MEVWWTGDLSYFASFLPLEPSEVQRKSGGLASLASPTIFCFKVTSPDFHPTFTGLGLDKQRNLVQSNGFRWKSDGLSS